MIKKALFITGMALVTSTSDLMAQADLIPFNENNWSFTEGTEHKFEQIDGNNALALNGRAEVTGRTFTSGTIEVDIQANNNRSFGGISFRKQDGTMEEVYLRMHKSGQPDALQYTPIFNGESNWQLYREHQAPIVLMKSGWNKLRLEVLGSSVEIFINDEKKHTIPELRTENKKGGIGLFALFGNRFTNFRVTNTEKQEQRIAHTTQETDKTIITEWELSQAAQYNSKMQVDRKFLESLIYDNVVTEPSGLLPISKFRAKPSHGTFEENSEDFVVARLKIDSESVQAKSFSFDYSDRVIVVLNGKKIFVGKNAFRLKGPQFQGHLGIDANTIILNLNKGSNTLDFVVIEKANGWGLMGKFENLDGINGSWITEK